MGLRNNESIMQLVLQKLNLVTSLAALILCFLPWIDRLKKDDARHV